MSNSIPLPAANSPRVAGYGDLTTGAFGLQKVIQDLSLFRSIFSFGVPSDTWYEEVNEVEQTSFVNATAINGKLKLTSGAVLNDQVNLRSFRSPRYEPNRGHAYSAAMFFPSPTAAGVRNFGLFVKDSGVFFSLRADGLYAVARSKVNAVISEQAEKIINIPDLVQLPNGTLYTIQYSKGVGDIRFQIADPESGTSVLSHVMRFASKQTELNIINPTLPVNFECINLGDEVVLECGCIDISSEGGLDYAGTYGVLATSTDTGSVLVSGFNPLVMAVRNLKTFNGLVNTIDIQNLDFYAYSDQRSVVRVWTTRDWTAITEGTQTWQTFRDGNIEYLEFDPGAGTPATFDTAKANLRFGVRVNIDDTVKVETALERAASLTITPGDMIVFTIHRETGGTANVGLTYEFSEER